jgi:hypothetical protein
MSLADLLSALDRGDVTDAKTVAALLLYERRLRSGAGDVAAAPAVR